MESRTSRLVARVAWIVPIVLFFLTANQFKVARDLATTLREGEPVQAEITRYFRSDRKDVTQAEVDLRAVTADGVTRQWEHLALPYSIAHRIDDQDSVAVRVSPGAAQEVVIETIGGTQQRIALYNGIMSLVVFLLALAGVWSWNRWLKRTPDPPATHKGAIQEGGGLSTE